MSQLTSERLHAIYQVPINPNASTDWQTDALAYLQRLCAAEYASDKAAHIRRVRQASTFRYVPSEYVSMLCYFLGRNAEEQFKAHKMLQGYASRIGA